MSSLDVWIYVVMIMIYFVLNVVGTVYYTRLRHKEQKPVGLLSVLLGWFFMPFLNLYSPIAYGQDP
jgi:predicted membrane channel-forming protein YqfA (hemolysin III family)